MQTVTIQIPASQVDKYCEAISNSITSIDRLITIKFRLRGLAGLDDGNRLLDDRRHLLGLLDAVRKAAETGP
jgi:hypothetical protein